MRRGSLLLLCALVASLELPLVLDNASLRLVFGATEETARAPPLEARGVPSPASPPRSRPGSARGSKLRRNTGARALARRPQAA